MIAFSDVRFGYDATRPVVDKLSIQIEKGEFIAVIGPNGAGKSTLLRLLLGLRAPQTGSVTIDGKNVRQLNPRILSRRIAAVLQDESVDFPFSVREIVLMGRTPHLGTLGLEQKSDLEVVEQAMAATDVLTLADRPIVTLSGGERKRVFLARALAQATEVLLLDEPASALDIFHQIEFFELLKKRHQLGTTVIAVVHDLNLAAAYADRVLLLERGGRCTLGRVQEVLTYQRVREAFGVDVYVGVNEITGSRFLIPMAAKSQPLN